MCTITKKSECIIPCERYSSLNKLIHITAYVLKFVRILKSRLSGNKAEPSIELLSLHDIDSAKTLLYTQIQSEFANYEKFENQKESLKVFEDKAGVLHCKGQIENSTLPYSAKFPVLLPRKHHFTNLVILDCHESVKHNGVRESLAEVRSNYWIIKGRQTVKNLLSKCIVCKKLQSKPYGLIPEQPLPGFRVSDYMAFSKNAVDFAGILYVRNIFESKGDVYNCYIALFTCAGTRAIHLELTPDLTGPAFIRVLTLSNLGGGRNLPEWGTFLNNS